MADLEVGNKQGVAAVAGKNINGGDDAQTGYNESGNANSVAAMRSRLNAINSTTYSTARLNAMTTNDMLYAIRLNDHASTIK